MDLSQCAALVVVALTYLTKQRIEAGGSALAPWPLNDHKTNKLDSLTCHL